VTVVSEFCGGQIPRLLIFHSAKPPIRRPILANHPPTRAKRIASFPNSVRDAVRETPFRAVYPYYYSTMSTSLPSRSLISVRRTRHIGIAGLLSPQFTDPVSDEMPVWNRIGVLVCADSVDRIWPAQRIGNACAHMIRLTAAVNRPKRGINGIPAQGIVAFIAHANHLGGKRATFLGFLLHHILWKTLAAHRRMSRWLSRFAVSFCR
jgi:hypothetical protein